MGEAAWKIDTEFYSNARLSERSSTYVTIDVFSEHNFWTGLSMNLSMGGVFVATHQIVPVDTLLLLNIMLPFEAAPILAYGTVRWSRVSMSDSDIPPGIGVQFCHIEASSLAAIRRFVSEVREPLFYED